MGNAVISLPPAHTAITTAIAQASIINIINYLVENEKHIVLKIIFSVLILKVSEGFKPTKEAHLAH